MTEELADEGVEEQCGEEQQKKEQNGPDHHFLQMVHWIHLHEQVVWHLMLIRSGDASCKVGWEGVVQVVVIRVHHNSEIPLVRIVEAYHQHVKVDPYSHEAKDHIHETKVRQ